MALPNAPILCKYVSLQLYVDVYTTVCHMPLLDEKISDLHDIVYVVKIADKNSYHSFYIHVDTHVSGSEKEIVPEEEMVPDLEGMCAYNGNKHT